MVQTKISRHATVRMQQRAIRPELLDFVIDNADLVRNAGGGCRQLQTRRRYRQTADVKPEIVERASRLKIIENSRGEVVTAMWSRRRPIPRFGRARRFEQTWNYATSKEA